MDSGETEGFGDWKLTGILVPPLCLGERAGAAWGSLSFGTSRQPFPFLWVAQEGKGRAAKSALRPQPDGLVLNLVCHLLTAGPQASDFPALWLCASAGSDDSKSLPTVMLSGGTDKCKGCEQYLARSRCLASGSEWD